MEIFTGITLTAVGLILLLTLIYRPNVLDTSDGTGKSIRAPGSCLAVVLLLFGIGILIKLIFF